jgi:hypothetical protein
MRCRAERTMHARRATTLRGTAQGTGRSARRAPALSLLEVMLSVVMLTGVATAIMSAVAYVEHADARDRRRLAAHEIANRLVLQWLDDNKQMPEPWLPIAYGDRYQFFFELSVTPAVMELNDQQGLGETTLQGLDRYRLVAVRVFDADESDPRRPRPGEELALLWRVYDPTAARNPDQITRFGENPENVLELINLILGGAGADGGGGGGRSPLEREGGRLR